MSKFSGTNTVPPEGWLHLHLDLPAPEEAMVLKAEYDSEGFANNWMGMVLGQFRGQSMPVLVFSNEDNVSLVPLVDNGVDFADEVVFWAPWPKISAPLNINSILGSGA